MPTDDFTPGQRELLKATFFHVWSRMGKLREDLNEDSERIASLGLILMRRGLLTQEEWDDAIGELTTEMRFKALRREGGVSEEEITLRILNGDADAFDRQRENE